MQIRQQELVHGEKQACDADCMEEQSVKPSPVQGGAVWVQLACSPCGAPMVCSVGGVQLGSEPCPKAQRPTSPKMFYVQNRQGGKGSSGRENRNGLSMVPGAGNRLCISWLVIQSQPLNSMARNGHGRALWTNVHGLSWVFLKNALPNFTERY